MPPPPAPSAGCVRQRRPLAVRVAIGKAAPAFGTPSASTGASQQLLCSGLMCTKCVLPTTTDDSYPSGGRNPLRRICKFCSATDKAVARDKALASAVKSYNSEQKVGFYKKQRQKAEDRTSQGKRDSVAFYVFFYLVVGVYWLCIWRVIRKHIYYIMFWLGGGTVVSYYI